MKKIHVLIPSLMATASMPFITLVGCGKKSETVTGFTFEYHNDKTAAITGYNGSDDNLKIPSTVNHNGTTYTVTTIKSQALAEGTYKTIHIPNTIVLLEVKACAYADELKSITIDGNANLVLETQAFYNCNSLEVVTINTAVSSIGTGAFQACNRNKYVVLPTSIGQICDNAFGGNAVTDTSGPNNSPGFNFKGTTQQWKKINRVDG
ncbi:MAG: leucine-rich repeat domain-containing protein [Mycoplasmoidaceae bacterium]|nr:leucine-rich repeat domain-containing protein [Mycoplasmoidaceae bacterium]